MALSDLYVTAVDLEEYFVDKDTGLPLAGGQIQFWVDGARTTPKLVYELTGDPTNSQGGGYSYAPLPNPVTLSDVGTIQDANGNNIPVYYYPYDSNGQLQLYYIVVVNALGVVQFTREAWPNVTLSQVAGASEAVSTNQISNAQFSLLNLAGGATTQTISYSGNATNVYQIAPGWTLSVNHTGAGSFTVARTSLTGSSDYPTNPNYWLTITPGANTAAMILYQRFDSPGIWSETSNGGDGWLSASVALAANSSLTMYYTPSTGTSTLLLTAVNGTLVPNTVANTVQLPPSDNPSTPDTGYVDIQLVLPVGQPTTFSSVQVVSMNVNLGNVPYVQDAPERQQVYTLNTYLPGLLAKPTSSFLVGWDFPLNPAQFNGGSANVIGTNASVYVWDQTIVYMGGTNAIGVTRAPSGALRLTGTGAGGTGAIVQYISQRQAREILSQSVSINVSAITSNPTAIPAAVSLFWTAGTALPTLSTGASVVASVDPTTGQILTVNNPTGGTWTRVSPSSGMGSTFQLNSATSGFNNYAFNDFSLGQGAGPTTAMFAAIIVSFSSIPVGQTIDINSVSLVAGVEATVPAPQNFVDVLRECQHFYWKTYPFATAAGTANAMPGMNSFPAQQSVSGGQWSFYPVSFKVDFPTPMRVIPAISVYSYAGTSNFISLNVCTTSGPAPSGMTTTTTDAPTTPGDTFATIWSPLFPTGASATSATNKGVFYRLNTSQNVVQPSVGPGYAEAFYTYHMVCDARLGIV
jgi:hypothetical protein